MGLGEAAGLAARDGEMVSRSFAKIFFSMTGVGLVSLVECVAFATPDMAAPASFFLPTLDNSDKSNLLSYIKP